MSQVFVAPPISEISDVRSKAILGFRSILRTSVISGQDEDPLHPFSFCLDFSDDTQYSPNIDSGRIEIEISSPNLEAVDYLGIAIHNGRTANLQGALDRWNNGQWSRIHSFGNLSNNFPLTLKFDETTAQRFRLVLEFSSKLYIGCIYLGKSIAFPCTPSVGLQAPTFNRIDEVQSFSTEGNNFTRGRLVERGNQCVGDFRFYAFEELEAWWNEYQDHIYQSKPVFFLWDSNKINDPIFGRQAIPAPTIRYDTSLHARLGFDISGYANRDLSVTPTNPEVPTRPIWELDFVAGNDDAVNTRNSEATYIDSSRVLQTAGVNQKRYDHDPVTGAPLGLLIEDAATNFSEAGVYPSLFIGDPQLGFETAPDGTQQNIMATVDSSASRYFRNTTLESVAGNEYAYSFYLKIAEQANVTLELKRSSSDDIIAIQDYEDLPTDWRRISVSGSSTTNGYRIELRSPGASINDVFGAGSSQWGLQVETGSHASSYIPTTGTPVTRAADTVTRAIDDISEAGAFVVEFGEDALLGTQQEGIVTGLWTGNTSDGAIFLRNDGSSLSLRAFDVGDTSPLVIPIGDTSDFLEGGAKFSVGFTSASISLSINGESPQTLAFNGSNAVSNVVDFFFSGANTGGHVRYAALYPPLTDDELRRI